METCRWSYNLLVEVPLHNTKERLWQMVGMFSSQSAIPLKQCREPKTPAKGVGGIERSSQFPSGSELWQIHTLYRSACQGAQMYWFSHNCLHLWNQFMILHHSVCPLVASWHDCDNCQPRWCCWVHGVFSLCIQGFQTNSWVQVYSFHCFQRQFSATDPAETPMFIYMFKTNKNGAYSSFWQCPFVHTFFGWCQIMVSSELIPGKELAILQRRLS